MSRNCSLSTQTSKHFVVIRDNKPINLDRLIDFLNNNYNEYALIVHSNDIEPTTGLIIPIHYHFVGNFNRKNVRLSTAMSEMCDYLKISNKGVSFDKYNSLELSLQYLIHKNDPLKTQHNINEIYFKGWSKEELTTFITSGVDTLSFERVISICNNYDSLIDVVREIGFTKYARYRSAILDLFNEVQSKKILG